MESKVTCKKCGYKGKTLVNHINKIHKMSVSEYCEKYKCTKDDIYSKSTIEKMSKRVKGDKNPAYGHGGRLSPFSRNFIKYEGLSEEEIDRRIEEVKSKIKSVKENEPWRKGNNNIEYYLHKGHTQEEAEQLLKERQTTFNLEICIEKYGEKEGKKRWKKRQEKWQNTLKSKPIEEIDRINRAKMFNRGFSYISQKMFWDLYSDIKDDFKDIYFAQLSESKEIDESGKSYEYMIEVKKKVFVFPDFFIKDNKKIIEFDGDYWHGVKRGNQKRDDERTDNLIEAGYKVLHIKERDYKANPQQVLEQCKEFIYDRTT